MSESEDGNDHQTDCSHCQCRGNDDCRGEDAAQNRPAEDLFVSSSGRESPAGEDGLCSGDCVCKVLPEKGKVLTDSRAAFVVASWYRAETTPSAIGFCSHRHNNSLITNRPDGRAVRISRCSLLI